MAPTPAEAGIAAAKADDAARLAARPEPNRITVTRVCKGRTLHVVATYLPSCGGWEVRICDERGSGWLEIRGPEQLGTDVWLTIQDMLHAALAGAAQ